jgi:hypothetical protein
MTIVNCKDCKHWNGKPSEAPKGWNVCRRAKATWDLGQDDMMVLHEGYDDVSQLSTSPDFFCAHGEAR